MATFSEKVKHARSELGLTQAELGEAAGVSLRTILDYEKGKKVPRQSTLLKLTPSKTSGKTAILWRRAETTARGAAGRSTRC